MCGLPGSGKSTWVKDRISQYGGKHISRDEIRFSMLNDEDDYFANENKVFKEFVCRANEAIANDNILDVYIDATHLSRGSRAKIRKELKLTGYTGLFIAVYFDVPAEICKTRNRIRTGRELVPDSVIDNMTKSFTKPVYGFDEVWTIDFEGRRLS
jgi:predicted kinase